MTDILKKEKSKMEANANIITTMGIISNKVYNPTSPLTSLHTLNRRAK